jgi:2-amino-4-hydroxy-6-hydroxymethyldihydropteridine diphosphokinase
MSADHGRARGFAGVRVFLGLGSNLGDRRARIDAALAWLSGHEQIEVLRRSAIAETAPWGVTDQPRFLNVVVEARTSLRPEDLLGELKRAERELGRSHASTRWGPREIDLDILLFGDLVFRTEALTVPHEQLTARRFVLEQLIELEPEIAHPETGVPLSNYLQDL